MKKRVAMFGGSFNPVHLGHIGLAREYIKTLRLDKMLIVPTYIPPHKKTNEMADALHRYNMCSIAFENVSNTEISDIEIKRQGASYTADTLKQLKEIYADSELFLITGADMFMTIQDWKNPQEIFKLAVICTAPRDNTNYTELRQHEKYLNSLGAECVVLSEPIMQVSSTQIRHYVKQGKRITDLTGERVEEYIIKNGLYRE